MALHTELTKRLGLRYPIIAAPLGRGSTPQLLAAQSFPSCRGLGPNVGRCLVSWLIASGFEFRK